MDHGLAIETQVRDGLLRLGKDLGIPPIATNDSHYTAPEDAEAHDALLCVAVRQHARPTPTGSSSTATATTSSPPSEMRALWEDKFDLQGGVRQHAADRRAVRRRVHRVQRRLHGARRCARRRDRGVLVRQGGVARHRVALPGRRAHRRGQGAHGDRARRHPQQGLLRLLPRGRRLHQLGQGQRHPGRPGPWFGCRLDRGLRAADHRPLPARRTA